MFNEYTHKGCIFECRVKNAFNIVKCIPWDYPIPPTLMRSQNIQICNSSRETNQESELELFDNYMNSRESIENCDCMPDCEQQSFETQVCSCKVMLV